MTARRYATHEGKRYRLVPWIKESHCDGCVFNPTDRQAGRCPNDVDEEPCSDVGEYAGMIFIECGKEGLAKYIADKLGGSDDQE